MSMTFTKLFSSITESTVWQESNETRLVWITMLAMADRQGRVWASIPGLADRARVPLEATEVALRVFQEPDKYSRTRDHEGRRIVSIDGGWRLLNHAKYRGVRDEEARKEAKRKWAEQNRVAKKSNCLSKVDKCGHNAEAEAEAEAEAVIPLPDCSEGRKLEPWQILKDIERLKAEAKQVKDVHCAETAHDAHWDSEQWRLDYNKLNARIKTLKAQLA